MEISKKIWLLAIASLMPTLTFSYESRYYHQSNLVSDGYVAAAHIDPNLVNPWAIGYNVTSKAGVVNNGTATFTAYDGNGNALPMVVTIPPGAAHEGIGSPTGTITNNTNGWMVTRNGVSWPAHFIFVTNDGTISAWAPRVDRTQAFLMVDNSATGASYKAITRGANGSKTLLYVTNFHSGKVEVYDFKFQRYEVPGGFVDPYLPRCYMPYGIQNINGDIYVSYAKTDEGTHEIVHGKGTGIVNVFNPDGYLLRRISSGDELDTPWGMALAPATFGKFGNHLLVANAGDGRINAYDLIENTFKGQLRSSFSNVISIKGLKAIAFENGFNNQFIDTLFFTAAPDKHGLYGSLKAV